MADILVVEDEGFVRITMGHVMRAEGHTVRQALNGAEGLARFREKTPDLVITDILMPDSNGIDMIRAMRAEAHDLPIIAISGAEDQVREALDCGASIALLKPFELNHLLERVRALLAAPAS